MSKQKFIDRRRLLLSGALAMGSPALRALVTGLPAAYFSMQGHKALAQDEALPHYLILSHQQPGDPVNANAPGTYASDPNDTVSPLNLIQHPSVAELGDIASGYENPEIFQLGQTQVRAARAWSNLDEDLRARMGFWHHRTFVNAHPDFPSVRRFNGALKGYDGSGSEEFGSMVAQETASALGTVMEDALTVGGTAVNSRGRTMPVLRPTDLRGLFASTINNIESMVALRDSFIDRAYTDAKQSGTPAQIKFLDRYARSRQEAASMGDSLGALIADVDGNDQLNQAKVAVALLQLNIAPVITMGIEFGRDNHQDVDLSQEVSETDTAMTCFNTLWQELKTAQIQDRVVFATLNVFGRTLLRNNTGGRNHLGDHHTMVVFGPSIKAGVIGGVEPTYKNNGDLKDFRASAINASTGGADPQGNVSGEETLVAVGKTLASAVGVSENRISERIDGGQIIRGALQG